MIIGNTRLLHEEPLDYNNELLMVIVMKLVSLKAQCVPQLQQCIHEKQNVNINSETKCSLRNSSLLDYNTNVCFQHLIFNSRVHYMVLIKHNSGPIMLKNMLL